ncbi:MAG: guanylate kinase [Synergistaceae bacterium]|nr:guanylate kinase [Synergistaceae bacterium]
MRGHLYVLSGPAGVGKGTVLREVFSRLDNIIYSISCTTRAPRPGEIDGIHYHFMDENVFKKMVEDGMFLEWAKVHGNYYGTRKDIVLEMLEKGMDVLLEIDVQGAEQVKRKMPESVTIFIQPPSFEELVKRLTGRGTESPEDLELRIKDAKTEIKYADRFEHQIINDTVDKAAEDFIKIVKKYREAAK